MPYGVKISGAYGPTDEKVVTDNFEIYTAKLGPK